MVPAHLVRTVVDIGANAGIACVPARFFFPDARILAFEPNPVALEVLKHNIKNLNIECYSDILGDGSKLRFVCDRTSLVGGIVRKKWDEEGKKVGVRRKSYRLHKLFEKYEVEPEGCSVKLDCEGSEGFIFGCKEDEEVLRRCAHVHLEFHPRTARQVSKTDFNHQKFERWACDMFLKTHYINILKRRHCHLTAIRLQ